MILVCNGVVFVGLTVCSIVVFDGVCMTVCNNAVFQRRR